MGYTNIKSELITSCEYRSTHEISRGKKRLVCQHLLLEDVVKFIKEDRKKIDLINHKKISYDRGYRDGEKNGILLANEDSWNTLKTKEQKRSFLREKLNEIL